jgi:bifunctional non-homologous end joining protein LigD
MNNLTRVKFSNLDKTLYPEIPATKKDVIEHYIQVAPQMLPFLKDRAVVVTRYPDGIMEEGFYGKDAPPGTPNWVRTHRVHSISADRDLEYVVVDDLDTLLWLANLAALEIHIPPSRIGSNPDIMIFDIDPEPPSGFQEAVTVAETLRELLGSLGLESYVKTTGKKGLHVLLPLEDVYSYNQTREFVHQIGRYLSREVEFIISEKGQSQVPGTVYIDYLQNSLGRTMVCPYSLRGEAGAPVSTPIEWEELERLHPIDLNIFSVSRSKDPWIDFWDNMQRLEV